MKSYDAVIIGSGINALVAGAVLSKGGWKVALCERNDRPGGAIRTEAATLPGYTHELLASWHPLFVGGPAYAELAPLLEKRGVEYKNTPAPTGVICKEGSAILFTDAAATAAEFDRLGDKAAWEGMLGEFMGKIDLAFGLLGADLWKRKSFKLLLNARRRFGTRGLIGTAPEILEPAAPWLDRTFTSEVSKSLLAPWALHNGLGPDDASSAFITKVISAAVALGGMPVPVGGGVVLVNALHGIIKEGGGTIITNFDVTEIITEGGKAVGVRSAGGEEVRAGKAVLASVTPQALYNTLIPAKNVPAPYKKAANNFRYGRAGFQIHLALSSKPEWKRDARLGDVAVVHIMDGMDSLSESVNASNRGWLPRRPTIVVGQPCTIDPTRAPDGASILWIQVQENPQVIKGDLAGEINVGDGTWTDEIRDAYAERVINQICEEIPNLRSLIKAQINLGPADLERINVNLVGGDPYAGDCRIDQYAAWRPLSSATGHRTPVRSLWHIGASTHPGPGLGGGSGFLVASRLLGRK